ncbi:hypothetical protein [Oerskovia turbata]
MPRNKEVWPVLRDRFIRGRLVLFGLTGGLLWVLVGAAVMFESAPPGLDDLILGSIIGSAGVLFIVRVLLAGAWREERGVLVRNVLSSRLFEKGAKVERRTEFHSVLPMQFIYIYLVDLDGNEFRFRHPCSAKFHGQEKVDPTRS